MDPITRSVNGVKNLIKGATFTQKETPKDIKKEDLLKLNNSKK